MADDAPTNPVKVIRAKCLDCCCGSSTEVQRCGVKTCPLYKWRLGKNPYRKKAELSEEQKAEMKDRLARARRKQKAEKSERE